MLIIILIISLVMLISHSASQARGKRKRNSFPGSQAHPHPAGQALIGMHATERMLPAPSEPGQARCREANAF
jgi:cell division protein FtsN